MVKAKKVFVSYRIESDDHSQQVISLAGQLRGDGIDAIIDRYVEAPREGWPRWTQQMIIDSDFVICVCTESYRKAFEGRNDPEGGLGVNAEGFYIMQDLYDHGYESSRYVPITFGNYGFGRIPSVLRAFKSYRLPAEYENLYRHLSCQPAVDIPPLGPRKELPPLKKGQPLIQEKIRSEGIREEEQEEYLITPHDYSRNQLAPSEGLFLSRIINELSRWHPDMVSTIWVAARGADQYIIDSIRIKDWLGGGLGPSGYPTMPLDAEYRFTFGEGSDRTHALNPALSLGLNTRPYASFSLTLAPDTHLYHLGLLSVTLNYHSLGGRRGTLNLGSPHRIGVMLAKHLNRDICVSMRQDFHDSFDYAEQVITPEGLQKGYEPALCEYPQYIPVDMPPLHRYSFERNNLLFYRDKFNGFLQARASLHALLNTEANLSQLRKWFEEGLGFAADLLGGIGTEGAAEILLKALSQGRFFQDAFNGLCVRHLAMGDGLLAESALANKEALLKNDRLIESVFLAALLQPTESLSTVANIINDAPANYVDRMIMMKSMLTVVKPDLSEEFYFSLFDPALGPLVVPVFIRGNMNDWGNRVGDLTQLIHNGKGKYEAFLHLDAKIYEFKIADQNWTSETNFGAEEPGQEIDLGIPQRVYSLLHMSHNIVLNLSQRQGGLYHFVLDTNVPDGPTLTVSF